MIAWIVELPCPPADCGRALDLESMLPAHSDKNPFSTASVESRRITSVGGRPSLPMPEMRLAEPHRVPVLAEQPKDLARLLQNLRNRAARPRAIPLEARLREIARRRIKLGQDDRLVGRARDQRVPVRQNRDLGDAMRLATAID